MNTSQDIFKDICALVKTMSFLEPQSEFFNKHYNTFEEEDENKLEYTDIHNEYLKLIEENLEGKLTEKYSKEQFEQLYNDIKEDYKKFEEIDVDAFETLISFTDITKFKEHMLRFKKMMTNLKQSKEIQVKNQPKEIIEFNSEEDIELFYKLKAEDTSEGNEHGWKGFMNIQDGKGYTMENYLRPYKDNNVSKQNMTLQNCKLEAMKEAMLQLDRLKGPYHKEIKIVERPNENCAVWYSLIGGEGFPDRDAITKCSFAETPEGKTIMIATSVEHKDYPEQENVIRMRSFRMSECEQVGDDLKIVQFASNDTTIDYQSRDFVKMYASMMSKGMAIFIGTLAKIQAEIDAEKEAKKEQ